MANEKTTERGCRVVVLTWRPDGIGRRILDPMPLEDMLNRGYEVVRANAMGGVPGSRDDGPAIPPALVYVLRKKEGGRR